MADSCGSYVEFKKKNHIKDKMDDCMKMLGGGPHQIGKGQLTDDSELAMCLMWGILYSNEDILMAMANREELPARQASLNPDKIAEQYGAWIKSGPFDIGHTTKQGLGMLAHHPTAKMAYAASSNDSQSNGSLMRITPLAVFLSKIEDADHVKKNVKIDTFMTHTNSNVFQANTLYCCAIGHLIR